MATQDRATPSALPLLALFAGAAAIAFSPIFVRLSEAGPIPTAFFRAALALPALALLDRFMPQPAAAHSDPAGDKWLFALAGAFFAADLSFWHWSIKLTSVANATLLSNAAPVFVALAGWLFFRERLRGLFVVGLVLAIAGAAALVGDGAALGAGSLTGDALGIATALVYAGYMICVSRLRQRHGTQRIMLVSTAVTALILLPVALISGEPFWALTLAGWTVLVALALICQAGGHTLIAYAMRQVPVALSSVALLLQPLLAALLAWYLFGERLGPVQFAGAVLILAGILLCRRATNLPPSARRPQG